MIENLPKRIIWLFIVAVISVFFWLFMVIKKSNRLVVYIKSAQVIPFVAFWLTIQALLSINGVYSDDVNFFPPKIMLFGIVPAIVAVLIVFLTTKGRLFIDSISLKQLIALHFVRIPVEIVLYQLYLNKAVPKLMTFEGKNFDIVFGISTLIILTFGLYKGSEMRIKILLIWNIIGLLFLGNIVFYALFSSPSSFQKFAFDQPNIAVLRFPFSWLPTFIVPLVLFAHLAVIRRVLLLKNKLSLT